MGLKRVMRERMIGWEGLRRSVKIRLIGAGQRAQEQKNLSSSTTVVVDVDRCSPRPLLASAFRLHHCAALDRVKLQRHALLNVGLKAFFSPFLTLYQPSPPRLGQYLERNPFYRCLQYLYIGIVLILFDKHFYECRVYLAMMFSKTF